MVTSDVIISHLIESLLDTLLLSYNPQLIISIIGGNNNQETLIQHESICRTVKTINDKLRIFMITNGYHSGIIRSLAEEFSTSERKLHDMTFIGINSLQYVASSNELVGNKVIYFLNS